VRRGFGQRALAVALGSLLCASPGFAGQPIETLVSSVGMADSGGRVLVELTFLNGGEATKFSPLARLTADLAIAGHDTAVTLELQPGSPTSLVLGAHAFVRARYAFIAPKSGGARQAAVLKLTPRGGGFAFDLPGSASSSYAPGVAAPTPVATVVVEQTLNSPGADTGNAFLANLSAYEPIYAVYGPGTSTDARLQISFKYQLFGRGGAIGGRHSWLDGIDFGFTQRLFWDVGAKSSPFRNIDYQPELFYLLPARPLTGTLSLGGQAGVRHESNGRDGPASRSLNTVYVHPLASFPLGHYQMIVGPQLWAYFGSLSDNPAIVRDRGNAGIFAEIGRDDGLRVSTSSRLNFGSGRGAITVETSYPLNRLISHNLNLYVFGQAFAGYGENLLDYDRRATRLRVGLGIVR